MAITRHYFNQRGSRLVPSESAHEILILFDFDRCKKEFYMGIGIPGFESPPWFGNHRKKPSNAGLLKQIYFYLAFAAWVVDQVPTDDVISVWDENLTSCRNSVWHCRKQVYTHFWNLLTFIFGIQLSKGLTCKACVIWQSEEIEGVNRAKGERLTNSKYVLNIMAFFTIHTVDQI